jgi:hypothetical protein
MELTGSYGESYFQKLKSEEARRSLLGQRAVSKETLYGESEKALGDVYGKVARGEQTSSDYLYHQQLMKTKERELDIMEEQMENEQFMKGAAGIGGLVGMGVGSIIPGVGTALGASMGSMLGTGVGMLFGGK